VRANISSEEFNGVGADGLTRGSVRAKNWGDPRFPGVRWIQGALYERAAAV
jgi:hypothetical protein